VVAVVAAGLRAAEILDRIRRLIVRGQIVVKPVDVNDLIRHVLLLLGPELSRRKVLCVCRCEPELPAIQGDGTQLQQLMLNLITNAADAMEDASDDGRVITITTARIRLDMIEIVVEDAGQGLENADASRLFEPFYTTKGHGMGMGLSICRTIVEAHGGTIRAERRNGPGARLVVEFAITGDA
jgi:signal transduction histidine kinase